MLIWAGCQRVDRSAFIDFVGTKPDFAALVSGFLDPETFIPAEKKDELPLFIPCEFIDGLLVRRSVHNVLSIQFGVLDIDHGSNDAISLVLARAKNYGHVVYSSFNHDPNGQHKYRVLLKFSRPVNATEWGRFFPRMLYFFHAQGVADDKCSDACHMYFAPGGSFAKYEAFGADGPALDVDDVLATSLPEGVRESSVEGLDECLPEEDRGEIGDSLREYWDAKLAHLVDQIRKRPYPGPIYDLKSHAVFGIARGVPHIISEQRLRNRVMLALDHRYSRASKLEHSVDADRAKAIEQVNKAIADGMQTPWWPPRSNSIAARALTEYGLAERLIDRHANDVRWEPTWRAWLGWNGLYWSLEAGQEVVRRKVLETVRSIPGEAKAFKEEYTVAKELYTASLSDQSISAEARADAEFKYEALRKQIDELQGFALKCETGAKVDNAITLASCNLKVLTDYRLYDQNPWLVNFRNGTLDLRTGVFGAHKREHNLTRMVPFNYEPDAKCPRFDAFLRDFTGDNERMIDFLWRAMGYTACGVTDEQKIFMLHGDGANGKSTLLNLLVEIFGQGSTGYGMAANSENLLSTRGSSRHETWRMSLAGARLVICQEVDEGRSLAESTLKELTGSDMITGRKLYQNEWSYKPQFTLWVGMNHLPHVRGTDEGIWRRLCVIECNANFRDKPDRDMPRRLLLEAPGIWARIAKEARAWLTQRLVMPREIVVANTLYRHEQDPLKDFIEKWCVVSSTASEARATVWAAYEEYCNESKSRVFHERKRFYAALGKQFALKKVNGERMFAGLRVKTLKERIDSTSRAVLQKALSESKPN